MRPNKKQDHLLTLICCRTDFFEGEIAYHHERVL
jgi:hypothetical protein